MDARRISSTLASGIAALDEALLFLTMNNTDEDWPGYEHRECGDHRPLGPGRSFCHDCSAKCSADGPCPQCELGELHHLGVNFPPDDSTAELVRAELRNALLTADVPTLNNIALYIQSVRNSRMVEGSPVEDKERGDRIGDVVDMLYPKHADPNAHVAERRRRALADFDFNYGQPNGYAECPEQTCEYGSDDHCKTIGGCVRKNIGPARKVQ